MVSWAQPLRILIAEDNHINQMLVTLLIEKAGHRCDVPVMLEFRKTHGDAALASLSRWHEFETENPDTFSAMYQFWLRKPR